MTLLAGAGVLALVERLGTPRDRGLLPALWLLAVPLAYSLVSPRAARCWGTSGATTSRSSPCSLLGVLGLERAAAALGRRACGAAARLPLRALLVALLAWPTVCILVQGAAATCRTSPTSQDSDVAWRAGSPRACRPRPCWRSTTSGRSSTSCPTGSSTWRASPTPRSAASPQAGTAGIPWDEAMLGALERRQPDYLVIFPAWFPHLSEDPRFRRSTPSRSRTTSPWAGPRWWSTRRPGRGRRPHSIHSDFHFFDVRAAQHRQRGPGGGLGGPGHQQSPADLLKRERLILRRRQARQPELRRAFQGQGRGKPSASSQIFASTTAGFGSPPLDSSSSAGRSDGRISRSRAARPSQVAI